MSAHLKFGVTGTPTTQGSKRAFITKGAHPKPVVVDTNQATLKPWREAIRQEAVTTMNGTEPFTGPINIHIIIGLKRPTSAPKNRRTWPTGARSGDADKLMRACLDALTDAGVWGDDAQVVTATLTKDYVGYGLAAVLNAPGAVIDIMAYEHTPQERLV